jgi:hypothetical protein
MGQIVQALDLMRVQIALNQIVHGLEAYPSDLSRLTNRSPLRHEQYRLNATKDSYGIRLR